MDAAAIWETSTSKGADMTKTVLTTVTALNMAMVVFWVTLAAQTPALPAPLMPLVITRADIDHMLKVNKEDTSLGSIDAGKHVVDVWLDQREANPKPAASGMYHSELTEIYFIQRGTAKLKAGSKILKATYNEGLPKRVSPGGAVFTTPTFSGPIEGGQSWEVGPGDIVIVPPNSVHQWDGIPKEMRYIIVRVDPEKKQKAGFVQPLLKR
jgi:hypothetical protein